MQIHQVRCYHHTMDIEPLNETNIHAIIESDGGNGWKNSPVTWADRLRKNRTKEQVTLVALENSQALGYGSLVWQSAYRRFAESGVPEIHDVATAKPFRRLGVATKIIDRLEGIAAQRNQSLVGIGVGLYADYGAAQKLYVSLGYVPDGFGVTYCGSPVEPGAHYAVDDDFILWLTKPLG